MSKAVVAAISCCNSCALISPLVYRRKGEVNRQSSRWTAAVAGWIVATPGPNEHPAVYEDKGSIQLFHSDYSGWKNPVPAHADGLFHSLVTFRVYFGQIVFARDIWIRAGDWLRQQVDEHGVGLSRREGAQIGHWFDGPLCRAPAYLLRKPAPFAGPMDLSNPLPVPEEVTRCGTFDAQKTDGVPAEWLDAIEHYAEKLDDAIGRQLGESAPTAPIEVKPSSSPPAIVLGGPGTAVFVKGKEKPPLTNAQYNVIQTTISAGKKGIGKDELAQKSGHTDAVKILKRIAAIDADWKDVIGLAGKPGGRYRVLDPH